MNDQRIGLPNPSFIPPPITPAASGTTPPKTAQPNTPTRLPVADQVEKKALKEYTFGTEDIAFELDMNLQDDAATLRELKGRFQSLLQNLATQDPAKLEQVLTTIFGDKAKLKDLTALARKGQLPLPADVQLVSDEVLQGANGAYIPQNGGKILLNEALLANPEKLLAVFIEEAGHHLDQALGGEDSIGDEGQLFRIAILNGGQLTPEAIAAAQSDQDHGVLMIDGQQVNVEFDKEDPNLLLKAADRLGQKLKSQDDVFKLLNEGVYGDTKAFDTYKKDLRKTLKYYQRKYDKQNGFEEISATIGKFIKALDKLKPTSRHLQGYQYRLRQAMNQLEDKIKDKAKLNPQVRAFLDNPQNDLKQMQSRLRMAFYLSKENKDALKAEEKAAHVPTLLFLDASSQLRDIQAKYNIPELLDRAAGGDKKAQKNLDRARKQIIKVLEDMGKYSEKHNSKDISDTINKEFATLEKQLKKIDFSQSDSSKTRTEIQAFLNTTGKQMEALSNYFKTIHQNTDEVGAAQNQNAFRALKNLSGQLRSLLTSTQEKQDFQDHLANRAKTAVTNIEAQIQKLLDPEQMQILMYKALAAGNEDNAHQTIRDLQNKIVAAIEQELSALNQVDDLHKSAEALKVTESLQALKETMREFKLPPFDPFPTNNFDVQYRARRVRQTNQNFNHYMSSLKRVLNRYSNHLKGTAAHTPMAQLTDRLLQSFHTDVYQLKDMRKFVKLNENGGLKKIDLNMQDMDALVKTKLLSPTTEADIKNKQFLNKIFPFQKEVKTLQAKFNENKTLIQGHLDALKQTVEGGPEGDLLAALSHKLKTLDINNPPLFEERQKQREELQHLLGKIKHPVMKKAFESLVNHVTNVDKTMAYLQTIDVDIHQLNSQEDAVKLAKTLSQNDPTGIYTVVQDQNMFRILKLESVDDYLALRDHAHGDNIVQSLRGGKVYRDRTNQFSLNRDFTQAGLDKLSPQELSLLKGKDNTDEFKASALYKNTFQTMGVKLKTDILQNYDKAIERFEKLSTDDKALFTYLDAMYRNSKGSTAKLKQHVKYLFGLNTEHSIVKLAPGAWGESDSIAHGIANLTPKGRKNVMAAVKKAIKERLAELKENRKEFKQSSFDNKAILDALKKMPAKQRQDVYKQFGFGLSNAFPPTKKDGFSSPAEMVFVKAAKMHKEDSEDGLGTKLLKGLRSAFTLGIYDAIEAELDFQKSTEAYSASLTTKAEVSAQDAKRVETAISATVSVASAVGGIGAGKLSGGLQFAKDVAQGTAETVIEGVAKGEKADVILTNVAINVAKSGASWGADEANKAIQKRAGRTVKSAPDNPFSSPSPKPWVPKSVGETIKDVPKDLAKKAGEQLKALGDTLKRVTKDFKGEGKWDVFELVLTKGAPKGVGFAGDKFKAHFVNKQGNTVEIKLQESKKPGYLKFTLDGKTFEIPADVEASKKLAEERALKQ